MISMAVQEIILEEKIERVNYDSLNHLRADMQYVGLPLQYLGRPAVPVRLCAQH